MQFQPAVRSGSSFISLDTIRDRVVSATKDVFQFGWLVATNAHWIVCIEFVLPRNAELREPLPISSAGRLKTAKPANKLN